MNLVPKIANIKNTERDGRLGSISFDFDGDLKAGQVFKIGTFGKGETTAWVIDAEDKTVTVSFLDNNPVTHKIMLLPTDECITVRGPFGNGFSLLDERNILLISQDDGILSQKKLINDLLQNGNQVSLLHFTSFPKDIFMSSSLKKAVSDDSPINGEIIDMTKKGPQDLDTFIKSCIKASYTSGINAVALSGNENFQQSVSRVLEKTMIKDKSIQILFNRNFVSGMGWSNKDLYGTTNIWKEGPVFTLDQVRRFPGVFI
ncbi:hypothetical protein CL659_00525 [bacterium]|nr:hypothetical protein [bacterium]|tara:strand:+ start:7540 stop:8316 length:777 start_codon:yes stop_codon:yes gene_type:complete